MAVSTSNTCVGGGGGLWSAMELGIRKSKMKTNKKELKHMWKQEMKGKMGVGVVCPVRPFVRPAVCYL
jgi:hypothetical protein